MRTFAGLRNIIAVLRGPDGCPWDRVQTHESLRPYLTEETAEVLEAIDGADPNKLREELADLLFEVLLHVQLAEERGAFKMADVLEDITSKLVRRHPHVFGDASAGTPEAVVKQWDELKSAEQQRESAMDGITRTLPSLAYAQAIQRRAARTGFKWEAESDYWAALNEELDELRDAQDEDARAAEAGDAIFALASLIGSMDVDAEDALRLTCSRFAARFRHLEQAVRRDGGDLGSMSLEEKLALWDDARDGSPGNERPD
jgi:tetrapyrrole methylase family protein/MazG family protein